MTNAKIHPGFRDDKKIGEHCCRQRFCFADLRESFCGLFIYFVCFQNTAWLCVISDKFTT